MKYLIILLLLFGCATKDAIVVPPEKVVRIDPRALELCEALSILPEQASFEDLLTITIGNIELYANCANRQKNSVILLKQFSNIKE